MTFLVVLRCGLVWCQRVIKVRTRLWTMRCWRSSELTRLNRRRQATRSGRSRPRFTHVSLRQVRYSRKSPVSRQMWYNSASLGEFSRLVPICVSFFYALAFNVAITRVSWSLLGSRITFHEFYFDDREVQAFFYDNTRSPFRLYRMPM